MTCKDCIHNELCKDMQRFGIVDLPYEDDTICDHFKDKSNFIELNDEHIIGYLKEKWLLINLESEDLNKAIKQCLNYLTKDARRVDNG